MHTNMRNTLCCHTTQVSVPSSSVLLDVATTHPLLICSPGKQHETPICPRYLCLTPYIYARLRRQLRRSDAHACRRTFAALSSSNSYCITHNPLSKIFPCTPAIRVRLTQCKDPAPPRLRRQRRRAYRRCRVRGWWLDSNSILCADDAAGPDYPNTGLRAGNVHTAHCEDI